MSKADKLREAINTLSIGDTFTNAEIAKYIGVDPRNTSWLYKDLIDDGFLTVEYKKFGTGYKTKRFTLVAKITNTYTVGKKTVKLNAACELFNNFNDGWYQFIFGGCPQRLATPNYPKREFT